MHGNDYQQNAKKTARYPKDVKPLYYVAMGLAGEAGEVANQIKKIARDDNGELTPERKAAVKKELGDTMWYIAMICDELGLTLDEVMRDNNDKLLNRDERGTLLGDGDNR